jgi:hypothetical protein
VMQSTSVVYYLMAPGRGADVPKGHLANLRKDLLEPALSRCKSRKNPLPSAEYVGTGQRALQGEIVGWKLSELNA